MNDKQRITEFVHKVEECWLRLRMEPAVRRRLVAGLEAELSAALAAGTPVGEEMQSDVVGFAVERARARGAVLHAHDELLSPGAIITTAVIAGLAGVAVGWFLLLVGPLGETIFSWFGFDGALISIAATGTLVVGATAIALILLFERFGRTIRSALSTAAIGLCGGAAGLALAIALGHATNYSTDSRTVLVEVSLVAFGLVGAIAVRLDRLRPPVRSRP